MRSLLDDYQTAFLREVLDKKLLVFPIRRWGSEARKRATGCKHNLDSPTRLLACQRRNTGNGPAAQFHNAVGTLHDSMVVCGQDKNFTESPCN